jgi:hypothetical protein
LGKRVAASWLIGVGVDLQSGADPGVPEYHLGIPGGNAEILEQ